MFTSILKKPELYNKELREYCLQSTMDSIKRIPKNVRFNLVKKYTYSDDNPNNNNSAGILLYFLSASTFAFYLYKRNM
jgi:hypothetical protein